MSTNPSSSDDLSPMSLVRKLHEGALAPSSVAPDSRRGCVEYLTNEGYCAEEIAEIFKVSSRTINRDRSAIRESHAVTRDPALVSFQVGQLLQQADLAIQRLRRISKEAACPPSAKVDAELGAWTVARELVEALQSLGYLPTAAQELRADMTHRLGAPQSVAQTLAELKELRLLLEQSDSHQDTHSQLLHLEATLTEQVVNDKVTELADEADTQEGGQGHDHN